MAQKKAFSSSKSETNTPTSISDTSMAELLVPENDPKTRRFQRSSSEKIAFMAENRLARGVEFQLQLGQAHEDLKKANDNLEAAKMEKSRILDELNEMKKVVEEANLRLSEALLAHKRTHDSFEFEKVRSKDLEKVSNESAQKRDQLWQLELEAVQKQHAVNEEALLFAAREIERVNEELILAIKERNEAQDEAEYCKRIAEANAKQAMNLSLEIESLKKLLKTAHITHPVDEEKPSNSHMKTAPKEFNESPVYTNSMVVGDKKSKDEETDKIETESLNEGQELEENNRKNQSQVEDNSFDSNNKIQMLEKELEKAKESEAKMLESLTYQTKLYEETKILLEEAKLEIESLDENIASLSNSMTLDGSLQWLEIYELQRTVRTLESELQMFKEREEMALSNNCNLAKEISMLKDELTSAVEAEEKSRKAMDDLAIALTEVTTEAGQAKEKLASAQSDLENYKIETENLRQIVENAEEKHQSLLNEARKEIECYKEVVELLKQEAEESATSWSNKEVGLLHYIKQSEEEIEIAQEENEKLMASLREAEEETEVTRVEIRNLRDIVKQAINEATVAKEAAEIARIENSQLKDNISDLSSQLERTVQENTHLKIKMMTNNEKERKWPQSTKSTPISSKSGDISFVTMYMDAKEQGELEKERPAAKVAKGSRQMLETPSGHPTEQSFRYPQLEHVWNRIRNSTANSLSHERSDLYRLDVLPKHNSRPEEKTSTLVHEEDEQTVRLDNHRHRERNYDDFQSDRSPRLQEIKQMALIQRFGGLLKKPSS